MRVWPSNRPAHGHPEVVDTRAGTRRLRPEGRHKPTFTIDDEVATELSGVLDRPTQLPPPS